MSSRPLALVTGGSSGIGRATAIELAQRGWDLIVQYGANHSGAKETQDSVMALGAQCGVVSLNLDDVGSADDFWRPVVAEAANLTNNQTAASPAVKGAAGSGQQNAAPAECQPQFGAVVLNAGIDQRLPLSEYSLKDIERTFHVNTFVPTLVVGSAEKYVMSGGAITITSSNAADKPLASTLPYSMSKAAINALVAGAYGVLAEHGIRLNAVAPGIVDTPLQTRERIEAFSASGLVGSPHDIATVIAFTVSREARWINGQVITAAGNA